MTASDRWVRAAGPVAEQPVLAVRLRHARIHAEDCADCESKAGFVDRIEREITLTGGLTPEQRTRMLEIAERCPVHRTLMGEIRILTRLA